MKRTFHRLYLLVLSVGLLLAGFERIQGQTLPPTRKLVLVTLDGVRCEELFGGIDLAVMKHFAQKNELKSIRAYREFWAESAEERRETLMPFFWKTLMRDHGSVIGNESLGSVVHLKNRWRVSYPGYSELLTGRVEDEQITGNKAVYNPNQTVLEFIQQARGLDFHQVAVFASWDVMPFIVQRSENTLFTNSGFDAYETNDPVLMEISKLQFETRTPWDSVRPDAYTKLFAFDHLGRYRPDLLYMSLGETDDWAHDKRYDRVLEAIHQADEYLRQLFAWIQRESDYKGQTTVLITTDHGRGRTPFTWQHHNDKLPGARSTWLAVVNPHLKKRGEWSHHRRVHSVEIAATFARFGGHDFVAANPGAAGPIEFLFVP